MGTLRKYLLENQFIAGILFLLALFLIYVLKETLVVIFISYIIVAAQLPLVNYLKKKGIPNTIAVILVFFTVLVVFAGIIAPLIPFFAAQIQQLLKGFPFYVNEAALALGIELNFREVSEILNPASIGQNAFAVAGGVFGIFFGIFASLAISFYLLLGYEKIKKHVASLFPKEKHHEIVRLIDQVNIKLGAWLQGQIALSVVVGVITWLVLTIIGMPFALPLAVIAGVLEILPSIGPAIAAVPAIIVALTISPNQALIVIAAYVLIQLAENNLLVPRIMSKAVGLNPVVVIIGVVVGSSLLGVAGALLSVPLISLITLIVRDIQQNGKSEAVH